MVAGSSAGRGRRAPSRRSRAWTVVVSALLHAGLLLAFLTVARRPDQQDQGAGPTYDLVFDTPQGAPAGQPNATAQPEPQPATQPSTALAPPPKPRVDDPLPGPDSIAPVAPPTPDATPTPEAPLPPQPTAPAKTAPAQPTPDQTAPPQPPAAATVTPEPAPAESAAPQVNLQVPSPELPQASPVPDFVPPAPPPPLPASPARPVPQRPRTAPPPQAQAGTFANPMDLNLGPSTTRNAAARVGARPGTVASRSLDLSPGAPRGPNRAEAFFDARAARLGADWEEALKTYWLRHRYYPQQAAENGEDGTVDLELTVNSSGRVQSASIKGRSGSQFIDMAAIGTWRNAQLPPLPPELGPNYTFTITINYMLIR